MINNDRNHFKKMASVELFGAGVGLLCTPALNVSTAIEKPCTPRGASNLNYEEQNVKPECSSLVNNGVSSNGQRKWMELKESGGTCCARAENFDAISTLPKYSDVGPKVIFFKKIRT